MGVLTKEQLDEVWNDGGLKYNIRRFHVYLTDRGLMPYINVNKLSVHIYELLEKFFVRGMKETVDGKQSFPTDTYGSEDSDTEGKGERG